MLLADTLVAAARASGPAVGPHSAASRVILRVLCSDMHARVAVSPAALAGVVLATAGTRVRMAAFTALGRLFVFDIALRDKHTLITTGPYAIVRHPAYAGWAVLLAGQTLCLFGPGSWWAESGIAQTVLGRALAAGWALTALRTVVLFCTLPFKEERMLRKAFGKEYAAYAQNTPHMFVPRVW
jgi:protein-S-isoprenylcysteine O-methyltransferase Ste14